MRLRRTLVAGCTVLVLSCVTPLFGSTRVFNFDGPEYGTADANCVNNQLPPLVGRPENGSQSAMYVADPSACGNGTANGSIGSDALLTGFFSSSSPNSEELRFSWGTAVRDANWTDATLTITRTGAFANYTYAAGDKLKITAGTGITVASYDIASRVDADSITLATDINAAGGDIADNTIIGEIVTPTATPNLTTLDPTNDDAWIRSYTGSSVVFGAPTIHIKAGSSVSAKIACYGTFGPPTDNENIDGALEFALIITETGVNVPLGESGGTAGPREFVGVTGKGGTHDPNTPNGGTRVPHSSSGQFYLVKWTFVDDDNNDIVEAVDVTVDGGAPVRKSIAAFTGDGFLSASFNRGALDGFAIKKPADDDVTKRWFVNIDDITIDAPGVTDPVKINGPIIEGSPRDVTVSFIDPTATEVKLYKNAVLLASATPAFTTATTHTFTGFTFVAGDILTATQTVGGFDSDLSDPVTVTGRVIFSENFDTLLQPLGAPTSGLHDLTDSGGVNVTWFATSAQTTLFITLNQLLAGSCPKSVLEVGTSTGSPSRILKFLGAEYNGSDANPLTLTAWMNGGIGAGARNVFELRGYAGTPTNLGGATGQNQQVAMGMHNTIGGIGLTNYLGRQAFGTTPPGYYALPNAPRVANTWVRMQIKVRTSQVDHIVRYPDGTEITNTFTRSSTNTFDTINIGSGLSNGSVPIYYDNLTLSVGDPPVDAFATPVDAPSGIQFPLVAGATSVTVTGVNLAAQQVFVYANNTQIGQAPGNGTNTVVVPVAPALVKGQQISVGQLLAGANPCTPSTFAAVVGDGNGNIKITLGIRDKSALTGPLGGNGGTGGQLEWVANTGAVSGAPQGKPLSPSSSWQTLTFDPTTEPITNFAGDGAINQSQTDGNNAKWGELEHFGISIDASSPSTGPYVMYLDEVRNGSDLLIGWEQSEAPDAGTTPWTPGTNSVMFFSPTFAGSSSIHLQTAPNMSQVTTERAIEGTQSLKLQWQWVDETAQRWIRLTNQGNTTNLKGNPMIDLNKTLSAKFLLEPADQCPADPNKTVPGVCGCGVPDTDTDGDTVADCVDNCPSTPNPGQEDANSNNIGDACETPRSIVAWRTVRNHSGIGPIALTLNATASGNGVSGPTVETRGSTNLAVGTGIQKIQVQFDGGIQLANAANISVVGRTTASGVMGAPSNYTPASVTVTGGNTLELNFNVGQLPDESCYAITIGAGTTVELLAGDLNCNVRSLLADVNMDGQVVLGDSLATKARVNQLASAVPQFDANLSGGQINLGDALFVKTRVSSNVRKALCP